MKKENLKLMLHRIKNDILEWKWAIIAVIAYFALTGRFMGSVCPLVYMTGFPCPSCGLTRAGFALLRLDFGLAWEMHPFIFFIALWVLAAAFERYYMGRRKLPSWLKRAGGVLIAGMILFYIYRMCMYFPDRPPVTYYYDNLLYRIARLAREIL